MSKKIKEMKIRYPIDSEPYSTVLKFLTDKEPLSEKWKSFYRTVGGQPMQDILYDTIIYNMPDTKPDTLYNSAADLYYYQSLLNARIERYPYIWDVKDDTLLKYILDAICARRPAVNRKYRDKEKNRIMVKYEEFGVETYKLFKEKHKEEHKAPECSFKDILRGCFEWDETEKEKNKKIINYFQSALGHTILNADLEVAQVGSRFPDKRELYIICIAAGATFKQFQEMRDALSYEQKDSAIYANNDMTIYDAFIQSVIQNYASWCNTIRSDFRAKSMEDKLSSDMLPLQILWRVDKQLQESGLSLGELLLHTFMFRMTLSEKNGYADTFRNWKTSIGGKPMVWDFYQSDHYRSWMYMHNIVNIPIIL